MTFTSERISTIASTIQNKAENAVRFMVAIAGAPGSGKSTLAEQIREELCRVGETAIVVPMDGFHFDDVILNERGDRPRKGAPFTFDVYGFITLLKRIRARELEIAIPVFHREQEAAHAGERIISGDARIVLVEGNYLLLNSTPWNQLVPLFDLTIALNVPKEELERRLIQRWLEHGFDMEAAKKKVASNDILNVEEVISKSAPADLTV
jgi:pantothenate kinase